MKIMFRGKRRKDGKYPITLAFMGGANAFGGFYPSKYFNKLVSFDDAVMYCINPANEIGSGIPIEITRYIKELGENND